MVSDSDDNWEDAGFVAASDYRQAILERLAENPAMPSVIHEDTGLAMAHVSRGLLKMRDHGLVELLVPEDTKKGRIYGITEKGEDALELVRVL